MKSPFEEWLDQQQSFVGFEQPSHNLEIADLPSGSGRPILDAKIAAGQVPPNADPHPHLNLPGDSPLRFIAHEEEVVQVVGVPPHDVMDHHG